MTHEAGCCACSQTPNRIGLERTRFTHLSPAPNRSDTPAPRLRHQLRHIWRPPRRCSAATERPASSTRVRELGRPVVRSVRTAGFLPPATPCCRSTAAAGCPAPCPAPCRQARGQEAAREGGARCPQASPGGWVMPAEMQVQAGRQFAVRHAAPPAPTNLSYSPSAHRALPVSRLPACSARRRRRERTRRLLTRHCSRRSECFTTRAGPTPTRATRPRQRGDLRARGVEVPHLLPSGGPPLTRRCWHGCRSQEAGSLPRLQHQQQYPTAALPLSTCCNTH